MRMPSREFMAFILPSERSDWAGNGLKNALPVKFRAKCRPGSGSTRIAHFFVTSPFMPFFLASRALAPGLLVTLAGLLSTACSPTLNWREVRLDAGVSLLLPCKPDKAQKQVPLGPEPTTLTMLGCEAGGATFAVAVAELTDTAQVSGVLSQWQAITLKNMKAGPLSAPPAFFKVAGADASPAPVWLQAQGQQNDGSAVQSRAAYFAKGARVVQVVMYAPKINPDAADTFFTSLRIV